MYLFLVCAVLVGVYVNPLVTAPIASFHYEVGALVAWGLLMAALPRQTPIRSMGRWGGLLIALCVLPAVSIAGQMALGHSTLWQLSLLALYFHLVMLLAARAGWTLAASRTGAVGEVFGRRTAQVLLLALVMAAVLNALAAWFQFLFPGHSVSFVVELVDRGRAFGNLRQPNQFALFEVWGLLALLAAHAGLWRPGSFQFRLPSAETSKAATVPTGALLRWVCVLLAVVLTVAVTMSGSRTGAVLIWMTAFFVGAMPGFPGRTRWLALSLAAVHLLAWLLFQALDRYNLLSFFSAARGVTATASLSDSRVNLWSDVLTLICAHPLTGVGYGMLNHALNQGSLLSLPATSNAHNLFLQLAAEHGLPLALLWTSGLGVLLVRLLSGWRQPVVRFLLLGVLAAFLHSQLEYPLWYAHLLLPVVFALGAVCGLVVGAPNEQKAAALPLGSARFLLSRDGFLSVFVLMALPLWATADYKKVSPMYEPGGELPILQRIINGHESVLFTYQADYASFTAIPVTVESAETHYRLGQRVTRFDFNDATTFQLMMAAGFTGRWDEAAKLQARMGRYFPDRLDKRVKQLSPNARAAYERILAHSMSQAAP